MQKKHRLKECVKKAPRNTFRDPKKKVTGDWG
jgi:hypothetical protein